MCGWGGGLPEGRGLQLTHELCLEFDWVIHKLRL